MGNAESSTHNPTNERVSPELESMIGMSSEPMTKISSGSSDDYNDCPILDTRKHKQQFTVAIEDVGLTLQWTGNSIRKRVDSNLPIDKIGCTIEQRIKNEMLYSDDLTYRRLQSKYNVRLANFCKGDHQELRKMLGLFSQAYGTNVNALYSTLSTHHSKELGQVESTMALIIRDTVSSTNLDMIDMHHLYNALCRVYGCLLINTSNIIRQIKQLADNFIERDFSSAPPTITSSNTYALLDPSPEVDIVSAMFAETLMIPSVAITCLCHQHALWRGNINLLCESATQLAILNASEEPRKIETQIEALSKIGKVIADAVPSQRAKFGITVGPTEGGLQVDIPLHNGPIDITRSALEIRARELAEIQRKQPAQSNYKSQLDRGRIKNSHDIIYTHSTADNMVQAYLIISDETGFGHVARQTGVFEAKLSTVQESMQGIRHATFEWTDGGLYEPNPTDKEGNKFQKVKERKTQHRMHDQLAVRLEGNCSGLLPLQKISSVESSVTKAIKRPIRTAREEIRAAFSTTGKYDRPVGAICGSVEKVLTEAYQKHEIGHMCAIDVFGTSKTNSSKNAACNMPTVSLIVALAANSAKHASDTEKSICWNTYKYETVDSNPVVIAHVYPGHDTTGRRSTGCTEEIRIYCEDDALWNAVVTLGASNY